MVGVLVAAVAIVGVRAAVRGGKQGENPVAPATSTSLSSGSSASAARSTSPTVLTSVRATDLGALLPAPLVGTAAIVGTDGRIYLFGGSGPQGFNATIYAFNPTAGSVRAVGSLPQALHDAGAAWSGSEGLICGGGQSVGIPLIYAFSPAAGGTAASIGRFPMPLSDMSGVTVDGRAYCLGGWTGQSYSDAVFDLGGLTGSGSAPTVVAHLPHAVRYAAAAALPHGVLVAGGRTASGLPTDAIQWVPLGAGAAGAGPAEVGRLPAPTAYAMAGSLGDTVVMAGGCDAADSPGTTIMALDAEGRVRSVGTLPQALCYGSAAAVGGSVYLFGGRTGKDDTTATAHVFQLTPVYAR